MNHKEEQEMELEALEAIFGSDFSKGKENGLLSASINLGPSEVGGMGAGDNDFAEEEQKDNEEFVRIRLIATFPKTYPEVIPTLKIENVKGMSNRIMSELKEILEAEAQLNLGMAMIFILAEKARDFLSEHNNKEAADESEHASMVKKAKEKEKEEKSGQGHGSGHDEFNWKILASGATGVAGKKTEDLTPCTKENFEKWIKKFREETRPVKTQAQIELESRQTGRQLFEKNSALFDHVAEDDGTGEDVDYSQRVSEEQQGNNNGDDDDEGAIQEELFASTDGANDDLSDIEDD